MFFLIPEVFQMKKHLRSPRKNLDRLRLCLFKKQMRNIYENVPYYREIFQRLNIVPEDFKHIDDIQKLPIVSKKDINGNLNIFLNENIELWDCYKSHTSGSTGQPFLTYFDKKSWIRKKYLSKLRARMACGMRPGERVAVFESELSGQLESRNRKHPLQQFFLKIKYFSIFDDVAAAIEHLIAFRPQNVYGPQSFLFHLARGIKKTGRTLPFLKRVYTSAEYRESSVTQFIKDVLKVEVYDIYGSTEFKEVAWECERHQGYHINEDEVLCEILDGGKPAPIGEVGDIVLTDLKNTAMPLIRYRIHDRGKLLQAPCRCGRTFSIMLPVGGRASEYILLPDGERISPYRFTTAIEKFKGLLQYQLIQESETDLFVNVIIDSNVGNETCRNIEETIINITRGQMRVIVRKTERILPEENGKFKVVKNMLLKTHSLVQ
ncbi:MAG: phenylacetate--CoA ligase family protein [Desulfobacteraceae bacterium]|nr:MAG: phenylacetate--CoA ligase family protein [Desulfobacteraceae bacterium]